MWPQDSGFHAGVHAGPASAFLARASARFGRAQPARDLGSGGLTCSAAAGVKFLGFNKTEKWNVRWPELWRSLTSIPPLQDVTSNQGAEVVVQEPYPEASQMASPLPEEAEDGGLGEQWAQAADDTVGPPQGLHPGLSPMETMSITCFFTVFNVLQTLAKRHPFEVFFPTPRNGHPEVETTPVSETLHLRLTREGSKGGAGPAGGRRTPSPPPSAPHPAHRLSIFFSLSVPVPLPWTFQNPTLPPMTPTQNWRRPRTCHPQRVGRPCTALASWRSWAAWRVAGTAAVAVRSSWALLPGRRRMGPGLGSGRTSGRSRPGGLPSTIPTSATTWLWPACQP